MTFTRSLPHTFVKISLIAINDKNIAPISLNLAQPSTQRTYPNFSNSEHHLQRPTAQPVALKRRKGEVALFPYLGGKIVTLLFSNSRKKYFISGVFFFFYSVSNILCRELIVGDERGTVKPFW